MKGKVFCNQLFLQLHRRDVIIGSLLQQSFVAVVHLLSLLRCWHAELGFDVWQVSFDLSEKLPALDNFYNNHFYSPYCL